MILGVCVVLSAFSLLAHAQAPATAPASAAPAITGPPDVLVIVSQQPGGADAVVVTYAGKVPHAQAVQDSAALVKAGGWLVSKPVVSDAAGPLQNRRSVMTGVVFQAIGVVPKGTGPLPIEPFVSAFRAYKRLNVVFFTTPPFQFQGARAYADNDLRMALDQHGTTYTYQIQILNPGLSRVPALDAAAPPRAVRRSPWLLLGGILGAAALTGLIVYLLTARLTARPPALIAQNTEDADDAAAESRQEVVTKP